MKATLAQILSITHGKLLGSSDILYSFLSEYCQQTVYTQELTRLARAAKPHLFDRLPFLKEIDVSSITPDNWRSELEKLESRYGSVFDVTPIDTIHLSPIESIEFARPDMDNRLIVIVNR